VRRLLSQVEVARRTRAQTLNMGDLPLRALPGRELSPVAGCCTRIVLAADAAGLRLDPLRRWLPLLESVTVSGSAVVPEEWLTALSAMPLLTTVDLSGCRVKDTNNSATGLCSGADLLEVRALSSHPASTTTATATTVKNTDTNATHTTHTHHTTNTINKIMTTASATADTATFSTTTRHSPPRTTTHPHHHK